jgi:hypothetical protein
VDLARVLWVAAPGSWHAVGRCTCT